MNDKIEVLKTNAVLAIALLIASRIWDVNLLFWASLILLAGAIAGSRVNALIAVYWLKFSRLIGEFNSRILLTLVFFVILTPVAFFYRLLNKASTDHFKLNNRESLFVSSDQKITKEYFTRPW